MTRGVGIAKRGFGRALSRIGYSEGTDDTGVQPMSDSEGLEEEIKGISGLKKIKEEDTSETKSLSKKAKDFSKGVKEGVKKVAKAPFDAAEKVVEKISPSTYKKFKEDMKEAVEKSDIRKKTKEYQERLGKAKGGQAKVGKVMREFGKGKLHSGKKGPVVKSRKQAIAIALSEAGMSKKKK